MHGCHALVSARDIDVGRQLLDWARNYLMQAHDEIKRPYQPNTVCPFVQPSVKHDAFFFAFHNEINGESAAPIVRLLHEHAANLRTHRPYRESEQVHKALLVVFPAIQPRQYGVLDVAQALAKDALVEQGVMVGQFHPNCRTPAAHNPAWREVSVSPAPFMALRFMAVHDLIFLADKEAWFLSYHARFADRFNQPETLGPHKPHLTALYETAKRKFLREAPAPPETDSVRATPAHAIS